MIHKYHNPFAGIDLIAPVEQRDVYDRYSQSGGNAIIDNSPFPRMVDIWFAGFSLAARKFSTPIDLANQQTFKFHEGSIFDQDSWRVQFIMLVAIALEDEVEIVGKPRSMMKIANGLAATGIPEVVEMLQDGDQDPIWNLSDRFNELLLPSR